MVQQILVPLDGSDRGERALPVAARLAAATGATLHLVRVVEPPAVSTAALYAPVNVYEDLMASERGEAAAYLARAAAYVDQFRVGTDNRGVERPVRLAHPTGDVAATLLDYERDAGIDLVVVCSHGRGGLARFVLGSVAERLLRHGAAPTLLVAAWGAPVTLERAVVPLDGSAAAEEALRVVDALAGSVVHEVLLLRAIGVADDEPEAARYLREMAERLMRERLACQWRVTHDDPAEAIADAAGTDALVVMAAYGGGRRTPGRSRLARWALGSVADRVAHGGVAGVLIVHGDVELTHLRQLGLTHLFQVARAWRAPSSLVDVDRGLCHVA